MGGTQKGQGMTKKMKEKGHVTADCVHWALKVLQINTKFTFKTEMKRDGTEN